MLPKELRVADNYLQFLKPLPEHFDVSDLNDDSNELIKVHLSVMQRYLGKSLVITYIMHRTIFFKFLYMHVESDILNLAQVIICS